MVATFTLTTFYLWGLLLCGVLRVAYGEKCPPVEDIKALGCSCRGAGNVECSNISSIDTLNELVNVLERAPITELMLVNLFVPHFPSRMFERITLQILGIRNGAIRQFSKDVDSSPFIDSSLNAIMLYNTKIMDNNYSPLKDIPYLRSLWLIHQTDVDLTQLKMALNVETMQELRIDGGDITDFNGVLTDFLELKVLILKNMLLNKFDRSELPTLSHYMEQFVLENVGIVDVDENMIQDMPNLEIFQLNGNPIETIPEALLTNFKGIFIMRDTRLVCDSRVAWLKQNLLENKHSGIIKCHTPVDGQDIMNADI